MSLDLVEPGSLEKPGPVGRMVRFLLGVLCFYGLYELITVAPYFASDPIGLLPGMSLMILVAFCIFNYIVNIGFSRNWNRYPVAISFVLFGVMALVSYLVAGTPNTPILLWLGCFFTHLGISFVLASALGTPGCEMRTIPQLFSKFTHRESKEHHCPVSIISGIDRWEKRHFTQS